MPEVCSPILPSPLLSWPPPPEKAQIPGWSPCEAFPEVPTCKCCPFLCHSHRITASMESVFSDGDYHQNPSCVQGRWNSTVVREGKWGLKGLHTFSGVIKKICPDLELSVLRSNSIFLSFYVFHLVSYTNSMRWTWIIHVWRIFKTHIDQKKCDQEKRQKAGRKEGKEGKEEGRQAGRKPHAANECKAHWRNPMGQVPTSAINPNITFSL